MLIRLDAAWLEPVLPVRYYNPNSLWITETGYVPYNDQFILTPCEYARYIYIIWIQSFSRMSLA